MNVLDVIFFIFFTAEATHTHTKWNAKNYREKIWEERKRSISLLPTSCVTFVYAFTIYLNREEEEKEGKRKLVKTSKRASSFVKQVNLSSTDEKRKSPATAAGLPPSPQELGISHECEINDAHSVKRYPTELGCPVYIFHHHLFFSTMLLLFGGAAEWGGNSS